MVDHQWAVQPDKLECRRNIQHCSQVDETKHKAATVKSFHDEGKKRQSGSNPNNDQIWKWIKQSAYDEATKLQKNVQSAQTSKWNDSCLIVRMCGSPLKNKPVTLEAMLNTIGSSDEKQTQEEWLKQSVHDDEPTELQNKAQNSANETTQAWLSKHGSNVEHS